MLLCCLMGCALMVPGPVSALEQAVETLRNTIVSLARARDAIVEDQLTKDGQHLQGQNSREDVLLFLAYLDGRIFYYCQDLRQLAGPSGLEGLPCPTGSAGSPELSRYAPVPGALGKTSEEKVAELEGDLNAALGEFDDMLLKEQETVAAHQPRRRESGGSPGSAHEAGNYPDGSAAAEGAGAQSQTGKPGSSQDAGSRTSTADGSSTSASTSGSTAGTKDQSRLPPTVGSRELSGDDDDIVARQLREAAEQETDPEIKKRLWEEYNKYKEGIK